MSSSCTGVAGSGSSRGHISVGANATSCAPACGAGAPVCILPCTLPQGALMPVFWNPGQYTNFHNDDTSVPIVYTLNAFTTVPIPAGICVRLQIFDGTTYTYQEAVAASAVGQIDVVVSNPIPVATVVCFAITATQTTIVGYSGSEVYTSVPGNGLAADLLNIHNTCLAWTYAPTATGGWTPAVGQPCFTIGFNWQVGPPCAGPTTAANLTAPNVPDQWAVGESTTWTWLYQVVYPLSYPRPDVEGDICVEVSAIKVDGTQPIFITGSWTNARDVIAQPWTSIQTTSVTPSRWVPFVASTDNANIGPFVLAAEPGQLVPVYFRPRQQLLDAVVGVVNSTLVPAVAGDYTQPAQVAFLVTSPIPARTTLYFSVLPYNSVLGGFGPRNQSQQTADDCQTAAAFVDHAPSFEWITGSCTVPAGTVVFIDNIGAGAGAGDPYIVDAHNTTGNKVGAIVHNTLSITAAGSAVPSVTVVSDWVGWGIGAARPLLANRFVTAVLGDQYTGDFPPLSPMLTMPGTRAWGSVAYGLNKVIDNTGLPGTVQAAVINSAPWTLLASNATVTPADMPAFLGMSTFRW
jgi:hypothetical protein